MLEHQVGPGAARVNRLIDLRGGIESPVKRALFRLVELPVEKALAVSEVNRVYSMSVALCEEKGSYFSAGLSALGVEYEVSAEDLQKIPATGPLVVVANHPFGAIEGLALGDILTRVRRDTRLLGNQLLQEIPQMRPWVIAVDVLGGPGAMAANVAALRASVRWLTSGGAL